MAINEYILGLMAIVTGLALSEMVVTLDHLRMQWRKVRWDWLTCLVAALTAYVLVGSWWISWASFPVTTNPTLGYFCYILLQLVMIYLMTRASLPKVVPEEGIDLADYYRRSSRLIWTPAVLLFALYWFPILIGWAFYGLRRALWFELIRLGIFCVLILLAASRRRIVHVAIVPLLTGFLFWGTHGWLLRPVS